MDRDWRLDAILNGQRLIQVTELIFFVVLALDLLIIQCRVIMLQKQVTEIEELLREPETVTEEVIIEDAHGVGLITDTADDEIAVKPYTDYEVYLIARTIAGEALITDSDTEMAAVAWCILNRVDSDRYPDTIEGVVTQENQFVGYWRDKECSEHIEWLVEDVLSRWYAEKDKVADVGRVLPQEYVHFVGDGLHNCFTVEWKSTDYWDWSLPSPYDS